MSLFKKARKVIRSVGRTVLGAAGVPLPPKKSSMAVGASMGTAAMALPVLPAVGAIAGRVIPRVGGAIARAARSPTGRAIAGATAATVLLDAAGNIIGTKPKARRINPLNYRALKRAIRRIERAKKVCGKVNRISIRKERC